MRAATSRSFIIDNSDQLATLLRKNGDNLLASWRQMIARLPSAQGLDRPTLNDHIPGFIEDLTCALEADSSAQMTELACQNTPPEHGLQRLQVGFEVEEVILEYTILRNCVHELADRHGVMVRGRPLLTLNRIVDGAIAEAVRSYVVELALNVRRRREDYLAFVMHDLRTPLNAISLATEILEKTQSDATSRISNTTLFKTLDRNIGYLNALVGKVIEENANLQTEIGIKLERRRLDLWPLIEALIYDLHPIAGTGTTRMVNNVADDMTAHADAALLRRIFQNLIANALAYTPHGEIMISARRTAADDGVECEVSDDGIGISEDRLKQIFEKFETDSKTVQAIGLGLTICKTFVEAHGGTITVESGVGTGSTFRFTLPD